MESVVEIIFNRSAGPSDAQTVVPVKRHSDHEPSRSFRCRSHVLLTRADMDMARKSNRARTSRRTVPYSEPRIRRRGLPKHLTGSETRTLFYQNKKKGPKIPRIVELSVPLLGFQPHFWLGNDRITRRRTEGGNGAIDSGNSIFNREVERVNARVNSTEKLFDDVNCTWPTVVLTKVESRCSNGGDRTKELPFGVVSIGKQRRQWA